MIIVEITASYFVTSTGRPEGARKGENTVFTQESNVKGLKGLKGLKAYRLRLGAALLRAGRTEEAVRHFERATEMKPDNASYRTILRYAYARNAQEPEISVDIELLELGSYDEDFVRRFQKLSQPV
jgi:tetratricopeptide (TPR) repeat protein